MDRNQSNESTAGQRQTYGEGKGQFDARFKEEPHVITDRLRSMGTNLDNVLVIGQKADGSPFAWSTGDEDATRELAKQAAPVLADLND